MKKELQNKRAQLAVEMRGVFDKAKAENRGLSADETEKWERCKAEIESVDATLAKLDETAKMEAAAAIPVTTDPGAYRPPASNTQDAYASAFRSYVRGGLGEMSAEDRQVLAQNFKISNAAQTTTTSGGGYLIPEGFSGQIDVAMKQFGGMLEAASVITTEAGNTLDWPTVNDTSNTGRLLAINTAVTNTAIAYGNLQFGAYAFSSDSILVPFQLLQDSFFDLDAHLAGLLGVRLGRATNTYFTTGTGSSQPTGVVQAATSGTTGATGQTTSVIYDDLVALEHSIDPAYRRSPKCRYMFNDSTFKALKLLKDGSNRPLWLPALGPGIAGNYPDTINGYPYTINQDVADMAASAKSILFGDFSKFVIRRVMGFTLLRLVERYADVGQVGFLAFMRADSNLIDAGTHPIKYYANSAT